MGMSRHQTKVKELVETGYSARNLKENLATAFAISYHLLGGDHGDIWSDPSFAEPLIAGVTPFSKQEKDELERRGVTKPGHITRICQETMRSWRSGYLEAPIMLPDAWRIWPGGVPPYKAKFSLEVVEVVSKHEMSSRRLADWGYVHQVLYDDGCYLQLRVIDVSSLHGSFERVYGAETFDALEFQEDEDDFVKSGLPFDKWNDIKQREYNEQVQAKL